MSHSQIDAQLGQRAIVLGSSLAGLLAARVLSERFAEVWLIERDQLPADATPRKGTPHAVHPHGLLSRGREVLEELFPGLTASLVAQGALTGDMHANTQLIAGGRRFARGVSEFSGLAVSRLGLEAEVRRRVLSQPQVRAICEVDIIEPTLDEKGHRATGVRIARRTPGNAQETLAADLVMDCTGRGSRMPQWLANWGYLAPTEDRVTIGLTYTSAYFRRPSTLPLGAVSAIVCSATPELPRPAVMIAQEPCGDDIPRWVVGLGGYSGDNPACSLAAMQERAREIGCPEIIRVTHEGELLGEVIRYGMPHSQRRRYERLQRFPENLLVMGDALTSFNPVYGQGMTVAACEAMALRAALLGGLGGVHQRFFTAAAKVIDIPWQLAVGTDLSLPMVSGPRSRSTRFINAYIARLQRVAEHDSRVALAFIKVVHLLAPPPSLFAPAVLWRVLRGPRGQSRLVGEGTPRCSPT
ncbi:MAG: monooxygenase [Rubrivivax sp.]|nr:MAG: monooxygenase [Rubrivivax sp.]